MLFRCTVGELNPQAKITDAAARHIVLCRSNGVPATELAALFGLNVNRINQIYRGKNFGPATLDLRAKLFKQRKKVL